MRRIGLMVEVLWLAATFAAGQQMAPPVPQALGIHSKILNEERVIWVRLPAGYERNRSVYPVLYQTDAPGQINEIGSTIDFLVENGRMPEVIVVGIANTDRTRDLTPTHADYKERDGTVTRHPTSGGADRFLDFIQQELMPAIESRYRVAPYRIFSGHSLGGLLAIHALITRPDLFNAYIAVSPALQWDDGHTVKEAQKFFATHTELKKKLFISLASEGNTPSPMGENFEQFRKLVANKKPKGLGFESARYPDEDHGSTVLRAHYAGLRSIFADWPIERDEATGMPAGGRAGVEKHYGELSQRYGYPIAVPEATMNGIGYQLLGKKKFREAVEAFRKNVEAYPGSANVYDSLGEGLEAAGDYAGAAKNFEKAIEVATADNDGALPQFKKHLERVTAEAKAGGTSH